MWPSARRSHEQTHSDNKLSRSSSPSVESVESHRRTSSEATPRPTAATTRFLNSSTSGATDHDNRSIHSTDVFGSSKRLGYLADKISQSLSGTGNTHVKTQSSHLLLPHSHSKADSNSVTPVSQSPSPAPMASSSSIANAARSHTSPSKSSYGRTYDSKLVTKEMHRLNLAHLPSALTSQPSAAPSVSSLALPTGPTGMSQVSTPSTTTDPWSALHVHVLPLFNGEGLKVNIEDLNGLVKRHISTVVSSSPSRALVNLENDASELIASGMVTLNAKLMNVDDEKLVSRVVETWGFFWDQILTYVEAVLLPLQIDPLLSSLSRAPKTHPRGQSSNSQNTPSSMSAAHLSGPSIDVRTIALRAFRDRVVYPLYQRLYARLSLPNQQDVFQETGSYQRPRLQQMLLVLSAQGRQRPVAFSLTAPAPQPTAGEGAVMELLRLVRSPHPQFDARQPTFKATMRTPSFLSGGLPRDRRGRIAGKRNAINQENFSMFANEEDETTPGASDEVLQSASFIEMDSNREKERELLDSLRSL
ncbi:hypothetical protein D9611_000140 [Ephemerocybe angulata]|uniref:HbrB n=1 Tax=Ephemerocybe angulata TaxID=980116 RepID=A0A8H5BM17_9AGAR|nr:hypothetical protein D9611_000140 [Tulosesus angulatus]